jgi:hypothetical protein
MPAASRPPNALLDKFPINISRQYASAHVEFLQHTAVQDCGPQSELISFVPLGQEEERTRKECGFDKPEEEACE